MIIKKIVVIACTLGIILACKERTNENRKLNEVKHEQEVELAGPEIGRQNYAIVWKWATDDKQLVEENLVTIADEVNKLWKEGTIVDAYYNSNATIDKFEYFPNVFFFLKAKSESEATNALNNLTLVQKGIASYNIHPVGLKWMGRNHDKIRNNGLTNSFAVVWTSHNWENATDSLIKSQADATLALWNDGSIENIYFDIEGTQKPNDKTDFVFFVNTTTEKEAKALCNNLPFVKKNIASYEIHSVGVFWLGAYGELEKN